MAKPPHAHDDLTLRNKAAAAKLRELGEHDLANAVDVHNLLVAANRDRWNPDRPAGKNVAMRLDVALKERAKTGESLTWDVLEGMARFVTGDFIPAKAPRARSGEANKTSLIVKFDPACLRLWEEATAYGAAHAEQLGWKPVASQVAVAYLAAKYPAPQDQPAR